MACMGAFCWCYQLLYFQWTSKVWGYFGYQIHLREPSLVPLAWVLALLPVAWMPLHLRRPSQFLYWTLYILVYVPSQFVPAFAQVSHPTLIREFMLTLAACFALISLAYRVRVPEGRPKTIPDKWLWRGLLFLWAAGMAWILVVFRGQMELVSFANPYSLRMLARQTTAESQVGYAMSLVAGWLNALFFARGWVTRRFGLVAFAVVSAVLVYMTAGQRAAIVGLAFGAAFGVVAGVRRMRGGIVIAGLNAAFLVACVLVQPLIGQASGLGQTIFNLAIQRTYSVAGLASANYLDFFSRNPLTHWSHIHVVNWFVTYPYSNPLGFQIASRYLWGNTMNFNAHFLVTDGLAAEGFAGMFVASAACALVFWLFDWAAKHHSVAFAAATLGGAALSLANSSLATTVASSGLGLIALTLLVMQPVRGRERDKATSLLETTP